MARTATATAVLRPTVRVLRQPTAAIATLLRPTATARSTQPVRTSAAVPRTLHEAVAAVLATGVPIPLLRAAPTVTAAAAVLPTVPAAATAVVTAATAAVAAPATVTAEAAAVHEAAIAVAEAAVEVAPAVAAVEAAQAVAVVADDKESHPSQFFN